MMNGNIGDTLIGGAIVGVIAIARDYIKFVKAKKTEGTKEIEIAKIKGKNNDIDDLIRRVEELDRYKIKYQELEKLVHVFNVGFNLVYNQLQRQYDQEPDMMAMLVELKVLLEDFHAKIEK